MYAITGITGNVGGSVAHNLLAAGQSVRAVMRDIGKGDLWAKRGCEVVKADIADATSLASAFKGEEGVFVLVPPNFDPAPGLPEARATAASGGRRDRRNHVPLLCSACHFWTAAMVFSTCLSGFMAVYS